MPQFNQEQFRNPDNSYRSAPFWAWNGIPDKETLKKQILTFKEMGFGGFHIHSRTGLSVQYLGSEFLDAVRFCVETAEKEHMFVYLYDEDRYPSGSAGGAVTKNPLYRARYLTITQQKREGLSPKERAIAEGSDYLFGRYDIAFDNDGRMLSYRKTDGAASHALYYAYSVVMPESPWFNGQTYTDLFNKDAVASFIGNTHEIYKQNFSSHFGKTIPSIFTDEPHLTIFGWYDSQSCPVSQHCYWSDCMPALFYSAYGIHLEDVIPALFFSQADGNREIKYLFFRFAGELFASSYADTLGAWCNENALLLTGHFHSEDSLGGQISENADIMRQYRAFSLPGTDILRGAMEFTTIKQAQSVVRQFGRLGMMCELFGVENYDCRLEDYKYTGDWLTALGVTLRVPHLSYLSMAGEAKRDFPPSFGCQMPWHTVFSRLETHFARINTALCCGKPVVKIGVIHPAESYWLYCSNTKDDEYMRQGLEEQFRLITDALVRGMLDFDFISESLLPDLWNPETQTFGQMQYDVILVPGCHTLRQTTLDALTIFSQSHKLYFLGACPMLIDGKSSDAALKLYNGALHLLPLRNELLRALAPYRTIELRQNISSFNPEGFLVTDYAYALREDESGKWLFLADTAHRENNSIILKIPGAYVPIRYNTFTGCEEGMHFTTDRECTMIHASLSFGESLLIRLQNSGKSAPLQNTPAAKATLSVPSAVQYRMAEPNVLLLDIAAYALDDAPLSAPEEILRINNILREQLDWEPQGNRMSQPWATEAEDASPHTVTLCYTFRADTEILSSHIALENAENAVISLNGTKLQAHIDGYYIDESISTVPLPPIAPGDVCLSITLPFTKRMNPEACYLLGAFGVSLAGSKAVLTALPKTLGFSSLTEQRMPFYGGNISYTMRLSTDTCNMRISFSQFSCTAVSVCVDGEEKGLIAFAPYRLDIPNVGAGTHTLSFTAIGGRYNTLAPLHNTGDVSHCTPADWRPDNAHFTYSYNLHPFGLTSAPRIELY